MKALILLLMVVSCVGVSTEQVKPYEVKRLEELQAAEKMCAKTNGKFVIKRIENIWGQDFIWKCE